MKTRTLVVTLAGSALLGAAGFALWPSSPGAPVLADDPRSLLPPVAAASPTSPAEERCRFAPGAAFHYSYQSDLVAQLQLLLPGGSQPTPKAATSRLAGELTFEVQPGAVAGSTVLLGRLSGTDSQARAQGGETLELPFLVRVNERCEIEAFARHQGTAASAARAQQVVTTQLSFSTGSEAKLLTGLGIEQVQVSRGAGGQVLLTPKAYLSFWSPRMAGVTVTDGRTEVQRGGSGWFEQVQGREEVAGGEVQSSRTSWDVRALPFEGSALDGASRRLEDYVWVNALAEGLEQPRLSLTGENADHQRRVEAMREVSYPQAMARFKVLLSHGANINQQWRDMAAYLDAHPEQVRDFTAEVTSPDFPKPFKAPAFLALGQTRAPEAREALLGVWRDDSRGAADRVRGSLALVGRDDVGGPLAKELHAQASTAFASGSSVARQSALHLAILSATHPSDSASQQDAQALANELISTAKTPHDYSLLFGVLGNLADRTMLPRIAAWTSDSDVELRRQLPSALRLYPVDLVHDLIVGWLAHETDPDVKRRLFDTVHHMYIDAGKAPSEAIAAAALRHLAEKPEVLTRQTLYHLLAPHLGSNPQVKAALEAQLPVELEARSGLYSLLAQDLPPDSVYTALASMPKLRAQFGGQLVPGGKGTAQPSQGTPSTIADMRAPTPDSAQDFGGVQ